MELPPRKDKGKAILEPNEEENKENRAKRARIATSTNSDENNNNLEDHVAKMPPIDAPLGIPFCPASYCGPFYYTYAGTGTNSRTSHSVLSDSKSSRDQTENSAKPQTIRGFNASIDLNREPITIPVTASGTHTSTNFDLNEPPPVSPDPPAVDQKDICTNTGNGINTGTDLCVNTGELCDAESMRNRMERIARANGLEGISMESAEVLNRGVNAFLMRVIGSCVGLAGSVGGENRNPINMEDLFTAMQLNPHLLGQKSREKLEKILHRCFKE